MKTKTLTKEQGAANQAKKLKQNVLVAKDVLRLIPTLNVRPGLYMQQSSSPKPYKDGKALQKDIPRIAKDCRVCAKGALVLAHIMRYDGIDSLPDNVSEYSEEIFGGSNTRRIEDAFEGWSSKGTTFYRLYPNDAERLREIMRNVIANGGTFKWPRFCAKKKAA